jgi:hypothetical protein
VSFPDGRQEGKSRKDREKRESSQSFQKKPLLVIMELLLLDQDEYTSECETLLE